MTPGSEGPPGREPVVVRALRAGEEAAVGELCVRAYGPSGMSPDLPYWDTLRDVAERARTSEVWVAAVGEEVVGTVTWCPPGSPEREVSTQGEAELRMLAVDPAAQGRGVGRALLDWTLRRARAEGCPSVVLSSSRWMTTAHRLYESAGFVRAPALDWTPVPGVDLLAYRLDL